MSLYKEEIVESVIGEGVKLEGRLAFQGTLKLGGIFDGDIYTSDRLVIMDSAQVRANIEADVVILSGKVEGNIIAKSKLEIRAPGYFRGTILTPILSVEEGGVFEGASQMPNAAPLT